jgi:mannose-1-phosphate guanylyltransferase
LDKDSAENEEHFTESPATIKSEDFTNSNSHIYNQTSFVRIEDALQAEVYECKAEIQNELHMNELAHRNYG